MSRHVYGCSWKGSFPRLSSGRHAFGTPSDCAWLNTWLTPVPDSIFRRLESPRERVLGPCCTGQRMTDMQTPAETSGTSGVLEAGKYVYCIISSDRQREFGTIG